MTCGGICPRTVSHVGPDANANVESPDFTVMSAFHSVRMVWRTAVSLANKNKKEI